jgi:hypothetical protein
MLCRRATPDVSRVVLKHGVLRHIRVALELDAVAVGVPQVSPYGKERPSFVTTMISCNALSRSRSGGVGAGKWSTILSSWDHV